MAKDYYKILGVSKNTSPEEIKRAFRELAHKYHPDKAGGNAEKFKEINEAYQVLGNPEKRRQYDQFGAAFENFGAGRPGGGFGGFEGGGFNFEFDDLSDILGDFFGMGRRRTKTKTRGKDIEMDLPLTFKEAVLGVEKIIAVYKNVVCESCGGKGAEPGTEIITCDQCGGRGKIKKMQNTMFGSFETAVVCPTCRGEGSLPEKLCQTCRGTGLRKKEVSLKINIPAGVREGEILRISGAGEAGRRGGVSGDLYLNIHAAEDRRFRRDGANILAQAPLDFKTAALGGEIIVETLDGKMKLKIPEGTGSGEIFRLRGKGVPPRGDLLVEVYITVPKTLTKKQKKLLEEWGE